MGVGGSYRWRRRTRVPDETDDINVPLRTPAYIPHTTPGAAENPQKHTKQRPASALTLAATPAIPSCHQTAVLHPLHGSHCSPVTRTDTRVQTNLLCTNRDIISTFLGRTCCLSTGASTCTSKSSVRRASNLQPPTMDRESCLYRPPRNALCSTVVVRLRFSGGLELVPSHTRTRASPSHLLCRTAVRRRFIRRARFYAYLRNRRPTILSIGANHRPAVFRIFTRIYIEYLGCPSTFFDGRIFARR